jgi:hypothetical protein
MSDINRRNPFAKELGFMEGIRSSFEIARDTDRDAILRPLRVSFSVGTGRGNAKPDMTDEDFVGLVDFLCNGNPVEIGLSAAINGDLSPAQVAARTMTCDEHVNFKVSEDSGSRTIKVPRGIWGSFTEFLSAAVDALPAECDLIWPIEGGDGAEPVPQGRNEAGHVDDENNR